MTTARKRKRKPATAPVEKLTFRLWSPYSEKVFETATAVGMTPNQFGRVATIAMADSGLLEIRDRMARMEEELIRLRRDFNNAVVRDV